MITRLTVSENLAVPFGLSLEVATTKIVESKVDPQFNQTEVVDQKASTVNHIKRMMASVFGVMYPKSRKVRRSRVKGV